MTDDHPTLEQQLFNITEAELKAQVRRVTDDRRREPMSVIEPYGFLHRGILGDRFGSVTTLRPCQPERDTQGATGLAWLVQTGWIVGSEIFPHRSRVGPKSSCIQITPFIIYFGKKCSIWKINGVMYRSCRRKSGYDVEVRLAGSPLFSSGRWQMKTEHGVHLSTTDQFCSTG